MELTDLHIFRTIVRAGGVTRAAEKLNRVQSNVTTRLKQLEQELGVALFTRDGRRLRLSPAGQVLLGYADQMLTLAEEAAQAVRDDRPRGVLRLGTMESTAAVRLPGPLSAFHERYPEVVMELDTGAPRELLARVLTGDLDAALVTEPIADPRLETLPIYKEELVIVASSRHPPIRSPQDVAPRTALAFHPGCPHRDRLEAWFARAGVPIERMVEAASYHAILGCAAAGMGVALMPLSVLESYAERARLSVHPLHGKFRSARTLLAWRKQAPQAKVRCLSEILLDAAANVSAPGPEIRPAGETGGTRGGSESAASRITAGSSPPSHSRASSRRR